jgi:hypothetical protein
MVESVMSQMDPRMLKAINDSTQCANQCLETYNHCVHMGGKHADPGHLNSLLDCIEMCRTTTSAMIRNSEFSGHFCYLNAVICERCAESCFRTAAEDGHMRECADFCRVCAESCRQISKLQKAA